MRERKLLVLGIAALFFGMILIFSAPVAAQHTGGLGIKKIPLNIATVEQLLKIPGMTESLAEAIVEYRAKSGFFKKPEDLLQVPGMTKEVFKKLDPQVGAEGDLYCVPEETEEEEEEEEEEEDVPLSPSKC
jgi:competence ComEA-like helix-hairpin-helix protein